MPVLLAKDKPAGFAAIEAVLIIVVIAAVVGVGAYVLHQKHTATNTLSSTGNTPAQTTAPEGTTNSVDQLTQQDAQTETRVDNSADTQTQQNATSSNGAVSNVGGAYNESNL